MPEPWFAARPDSHPDALGNQPSVPERGEGVLLQCGGGCPNERVSWPDRDCRSACFGDVLRAVLGFRLYVLEFFSTSGGYVRSGVGFGCEGRADGADHGGSDRGFCLEGAKGAAAAAGAGGDCGGGADGAARREYLVSMGAGADWSGADGAAVAGRDDSGGGDAGADFFA